MKYKKKSLRGNVKNLLKISAYVIALCVLVGGIMSIILPIKLEQDQKNQEAKKTLKLEKSVPKPQQETADSVVEVNGRTYRMWDGLIMEAFNNNAVQKLGVKFDLYLYDFELKHVLIVPYDDGATTHRRFAGSDDEVMQHIGEVRHIGCQIAFEQMVKYESGQYGVPSDDAKAYFKKHCSDFRASVQALPYDFNNALTPQL